jgi:uncharacterized OB-fold protein
MSSPLPAQPPVPSPDDAPFWEAAAHDRLLLPRCRVCGTYIWYPRAFCPDCHAWNVEWTNATGAGTIYSFTVSYRGRGPWADRVPFVIAYVQLDEGPRVLTNIVGVNPEAVYIGERVRAVFEPAGETKVLRFTPA